MKILTPSSVLKFNFLKTNFHTRLSFHSLSFMVSHDHHVPPFT